MATNPLTGDFEAVVQIAVRQIDAVLASLHQNDPPSTAVPMQLLHTARVDVGRQNLRPHVDDFSDWVLGFLRAQRPAEAGDVRGELIGGAPAGAAARMKDAFAAFDDLTAVIGDAPGAVRGKADVQLSTVRMTVPHGSTSEVVLHIDIRAHYRPAAGTTDLAAPIHGEVEAAFEIRMLQFGEVRRLEIKPSANDNKIRFHPAPGTVSAGEAGTIATAIRRALRGSFTLVPVDLPDDFPFGGFKGLETGGTQAVALGLQLSGGAAPAGGLQSVTQAVVGPRAFALAVSKAFVESILRPGLDSLLPVTEDVSLNSVELDFNDGSIDLRIGASGDVPILGTVSVSIRQRVTLAVLNDTLFIFAPDDGLAVSVTKAGIPLPNGDVTSAIIAARNQALPSIQGALNGEFANAKARLNDALRKFDPAGSAHFRTGQSDEPGAAASGGIAITPDGIIVRGDFSLAARRAAVVDVRETVDESAFTALESWIPAGRVERLIWSWVENSGPSIFSGESKMLPPEEHRFILPQPPGINDRRQICLRVEGTQIGRRGNSVSVAGGTTCRVFVPDTVVNVPSWWEPVVVPLWRPDIPLDAVLTNFITGHVSLQSDTPLEQQTHNSLIYFADWQSDDPLVPIGDAFARAQRDGVSLVVFVVVPPGAFDARRRELEAKLAPIVRRLSVNLHVTEDIEGGWTRTFAPASSPAAFLINSHRRVIWKWEGSLDAPELARAMDQRLDVAPPPRAVPLRLKVSPGSSVLDADVDVDSGQRVALHRLRGARLVLNFWQSWSAPCRQELRRLQSLRHGGEEDRPVVVAFHGGPKTDLDAIRKELGLTFTLVQDVEQQVARIYGVRCWPTTVAVDPEGRIEGVQFGATPTRDDAYGRTR